MQRTEAKVTLPQLVSDGMVLQRDREITLWGSADPGETITIQFLNQTFGTTADALGKWKTILPPQQAGGPFQMSVNDILVSNILIGDVWLCSGQSNMELPVSRVMDLYRAEVEQYSNPMIRHLKVPLAYNFHHPLDESDLHRGYRSHPRMLLPSRLWPISSHGICMKKLVYRSVCSMPA